MTFVIDASVAVKWLLPERGSVEAAAYLGETLIAPPMFRMECANAVVRRLRRGEIASEEAAVLLVEVEYLPVELHPVQDRQVFDLALALRHPVHDCAYLALARSEKALLVTADDRFFRTAREAGLAGHMRLVSADQP